jgi:hypothetical protein
VKYCVVVLSNGKCEHFELEDEARIQQQSLPEGVVKAFQLFLNFIKLTQNNAKDKCDKEAPTASTNEDADFDKNIAAVTPENKNNHMTFLKSIAPFGHNITSRFGQEVVAGKVSPQTGNTMRSKYLASISQCAHCVNILLWVFVIKFDAENQELPAGYKILVKQVILLDVFDQTKNATFWTHKPKTWVNIKTAEDTDKSLFDGECDLLAKLPRIL